MDNILLNFLVSIMGTLSSVASLVIGLMSANNSNKAFLNRTNNEPHNAAVEKNSMLDHANSLSSLLFWLQCCRSLGCCMLSSTHLKRLNGV